MEKSWKVIVEKEWAPWDMCPRLSASKQLGLHWWIRKTAPQETNNEQLLAAVFTLFGEQMSVVS